MHNMKDFLIHVFAAKRFDIKGIADPLIFSALSFLCILKLLAPVISLKSTKPRVRARIQMKVKRPTPMLLTTRLPILQSEKPRNSSPLPSPSSKTPSIFLRELDVFSTNNYFKFIDKKKKRNLDTPTPKFRPKEKWSKLP